MADINTAARALGLDGEGVIWRDHALAAAAEDERELIATRDAFRDESQKWEAKAGEMERERNLARELLKRANEEIRAINGSAPCQCHLEVGDSPCPMHDCSICGGDHTCSKCKPSSPSVDQAWNRFQEAMASEWECGKCGKPLAEDEIVGIGACCKRCGAQSFHRIGSEVAKS